MCISKGDKCWAIVTLGEVRNNENTEEFVLKIKTVKVIWYCLGEIG